MQLIIEKGRKRSRRRHVMMQEFLLMARQRIVFSSNHHKLLCFVRTSQCKIAKNEFSLDNGGVSNKKGLNITEPSQSQDYFLRERFESDVQNGVFWSFRNPAKKDSLVQTSSPTKFEQQQTTAFAAFESHSGRTTSYCAS